MLLTIERVAFLKGVEIFAHTPDHALAAVARILEEVEVEAGQTFMTEGAFEESMYLVVEGKMRVHTGDKTVNVVGPGETLGEMAVLDPEPRSASVTALEPGRLLRINREPFEEVIADRPEISLGIIRVLSRRLRAQTRRAAGELAPEQ
jgi:CRP-like cAMP-binding protein